MSRPTPGGGTPGGGSPGGAPGRQQAGARADAPGVGESIGRARDSFRRLLQAHIALLRAELAEAGRKLGIIVGLAAAAAFLAFLVAILLYVGSFLFLGEWLFGSMGWGIIHGTLIGVGIIAGVVVDLAGGRVRSYAWGLAWGLVVGLAVGLVLSFNVANDGAEWGAGLVEDQLSLDEHWAPTLVGLVVGGVITAVVALVLGWRARWSFGAPLVVTIAGLAVGGLVGAILASTRYDNPNGVAGLAVMVGLLTWIIVGLLLAYRRGFDPEARYAGLLPRESIAAFESSQGFVRAQWARQKRKISGR